MEQNNDYYLGRSCPTEPQRDPQTGALLCELPQTTQSGTVTPTMHLAQPQLPQTGASDGVWIYLGLIVISGIIILIMDRRKRKRK